MTKTLELARVNAWLSELRAQVKLRNRRLAWSRPAPATAPSDGPKEIR